MRLLVLFLSLPLCMVAQSIYTPYSFTNFAGVPKSIGTNDGPAATAQFRYPQMLVVDTNLNVFVADENNSTIRCIAPDGTVSTIAGVPTKTGTNDGPGNAARFASPCAIALAPDGKLYVCDTASGAQIGVGNTIRTITPTPTNWMVSTLAGLPGVRGSVDGVGSGARFSNPVGIASGPDGNLFVTDFDSGRIRKVTPDGIVSTIARVGLPNGLGVDPAGVLYVADYASNVIWSVSSLGTNWIVSAFAGNRGHSGSADGIGTNAFLNGPYGVALDPLGNLYTSDDFNHTIRRITPTRVVTTLGGKAGVLGTNDGVGITAQFSHPQGLALDKLGNIYVADTFNHRISKGTPVLQFDSVGQNVGLTTNNSMRSRVLGPCGTNVVVWSSTNCVDWSPVSTNTLQAFGFDFETELTNQCTLLRATIAP